MIDTGDTFIDDSGGVLLLGMPIVFVGPFGRVDVPAEIASLKPLAGRRIWLYQLAAWGHKATKVEATA